jgi:hypothetical protein
LELQAEKLKPAKISRPETANHILEAKQMITSSQALASQCECSKDERKALKVVRHSKKKSQVSPYGQRK